MRGVTVSSFRSDTLCENAKWKAKEICEPDMSDT